MKPIGEEMPILLRQGKSPPLLGVVSVDGDAGSQVLGVGEHPGDPRRQFRLENSNSNVVLQDVPKGWERAIAQPEAVALGAGHVLTRQLRIEAFDLILWRVATAQRRLTDLLQTDVIFGEALENLN
ncbi:MAG TPA: hypothetical protein VGS22_03915 [Thermoanaerobaculia bacterium]|nr:hypothetical protein [Thermoanaerobaculia bacterium]